MMESPVPLALGRLGRAHRPSLPLASLLEAVESEEAPRRHGVEPLARLPDPQDDREDASSPPPTSASRRRASAAAVHSHDRYTRLDWDAAAASAPPRRASLAVPPDSTKRRKSGRRPSWWNLLVPDNILKHRSRRASQQLSRSSESIERPPRRSKSRSVDHGLAAPADLEALRCKVETRMETVAAERRPSATATYTVRDRDTLTAVAARFDTTPSELAKLNRLATPFIFAGQQLLVPDKRTEDSEEGGSAADGSEAADAASADGSDSAPAAHENELLETLRPAAAPTASSAAAPRFLKINVRHITDGQGVVSGVLLVTPNALMFDPNVSDALVIEHGPEAYGVIAPVEFIANAAIFYDIAHMRTHDPAHDTNAAANAEIYYGERSARERAARERAASEAERQSDAAEPPERGGAAFPKAFDRELVTPTQPTQTEERRRSLLDHHWAIPSRERTSLDETAESEAGEASECGDAGETRETGDAGETGEAGQARREAPVPALRLQPEPEEHLVKLSCHDSGIDMREPASLKTNTTKKVYSDADIVLSGEWVPPVCIAPAEPPLSAPPLGATPPPRKPAAVSFSLDNSNSGTDKDEPRADKKNKMLKRLSYPLSWMEGLTGEAGGAVTTGGGSESLPSSADSHNSGSVFSKVFNSSPMNLVELGTGLFLSKTPSEEAPPDTGRSSLGGRTSARTASSSSGGAAPRLDYRSMVSVDDMPELFVSFDKLLPRPARASDDPPLYLRLRMGRPLARAPPRTTPLMSYGRKRVKPEYWFGVPRNRADELYRFLVHWMPELYGPLPAVPPHHQLVDSDTEWDDDERERPARTGSAGDVADLTRESWELLKAPYVKIYSILKSQNLSGDSEDQLRDEVLSMSEELRRALCSGGASLDFELAPPELMDASEILTMRHRRALCGVLPARVQGYAWALVFSTSQHGFSLASLYRKMARVDSPVLLVVQDTHRNVFGALTSCPLRVSEHFYGTGESLLFSFQRLPQAESAEDSGGGNDSGGGGGEGGKTEDGDKKEESENKEESDKQSGSTTVERRKSEVGEGEEEEEEDEEERNTRFRVWQWTGDNTYFIRGSVDNISIGAGDGKFGLWLDGDLYLGRTQQCTTYGNEPLTTDEDFVVKICECWAFV